MSACIGPTSIEALARDVEVARENSMLITVQGKGPTRDAAVEVANTTVDVFLEAQHEVAANQLREGVVAMRKSLTEAEGALTESRQRYDAFRAENHVDDFPAEIQAAIASLPSARVRTRRAIELQGVQAREASLRRAQGEAPSNIVLSRSEIDADSARLAQAETELAGLRARYAEDHPMVQSLAAEVAALRARANVVPPSVTAQTLGRNPMHDSLALQVEESSAARRSVEERARAVTRVQSEAEDRASRLTVVQGEAARRLADVTANQEHVALLLKQIAMAEDDVRGASSGFQVVSRATPPEHSEHGIGRIFAVASPLLALLYLAVRVLTRELRGLRAKTATEVAFWSNAPVLGSCTREDPTTTDQLARDVADALEKRAGVVGIASWDDERDAESVAELAGARLARRGRGGAIWQYRSLATDDHETGVALADLLEGETFRDEIEALRVSNRTVLVALPSLREPMAIRAALRGLDALVVVVGSGGPDVKSLALLRRVTGLERRGVALVVRNVAPGFFARETRAVGDPALLWRDARARRPRAPGPEPHPVDPAGDPSIATGIGAPIARLRVVKR